MKSFLSIFLISILCYTASAQKVDVTPTFNPAFFGGAEEVTISFDVTGTSMASLSEAFLWMWAPDLSIDAPSNINPASKDATASAPAKCTKSTTDGKTVFSITLTPQAFLNAGDKEVKKIGLILKANDWPNGQTNDFITEISDGFSLKVEQPAFNYGFYTTETALDIVAKTSATATITLYVDQQNIESVSAKEFTTSHTIIKDGSVHELLITAVTATDSAAYKHTYISNAQTQTATLPEGVRDGINYIDNTTATLVLTAPNKENVFVIGDFNNWSLTADHQMKKDGDKFWVTIDNLTPAQEYIFQYLVDGNIRIADPYAEKISSQFDDPEIISENKYPGLKPYPSQYTSEAASYLQTAKTPYVWQVKNFDKPAKEDLIIYELLVRDFTEDRSYRAVIDRLDYLDSLGVNAIELMPVMEFEGNLSWGYNPSSMLAMDKFYGSENDLKELIDKAHARGMAVIFDIVLNHAFGRSSLVRLDNEGLYGPPTSTNPWLNTNAKHDFNVGYDFNHESTYTKYYSERIVEYWIKEFNIDGYRFDLSKGLTQKPTLGNVGLWGQYDASRVAILKNIADHVWEADPEAYVILEHFADNSEEEILADYGMMLWGNMHGAFNNVTKGTSGSFGDLYHGNRGWDKPHLVGYFESHDEERLMWSLNKNLSTSSHAHKMQRAQQAAVFLLAVPGPKMIWQFGEFGYDLELNDDRVGVKPTKWEYLNDENRRKLFAVYQSLSNLRTKTNYVDQEYFSWSTGGTFKWININHPEVQITIVANFGRSEATADPHFLKAGTWFNYFTGEEVVISDANAEITLQSGEYLMLTSKKIENYISESATILSNQETKNVGNIGIYPNPVADELHFSSADRILKYKVVALNGAIISQGVRVDGHSSNQQTISVQNMKKGLYLLEVQTATGINTQKFYKK